MNLLTPLASTSICSPSVAGAIDAKDQTQAFVHARQASYYLAPILSP